MVRIIIFKFIIVNNDRIVKECMVVTLMNAPAKFDIGGESHTFSWD